MNRINQPQGWFKRYKKRLSSWYGYHLRGLIKKSQPLTEEWVGIRFLHVAPKKIQEPVDVYINGKRMVRSIPFGFVTRYVQVPVGDNWIQVYRSRKEKNLIHSQILSVRGGGTFTLLLMERGKTDHLMVIPDRYPLRKGKMQLRFLNFAMGSPNVDLVNQKGNCFFRNIPFTEVTSYRPFPRGNQRLSVQVSGTHQILYQLPAFFYPTDQVFSLIAMGINQTNSYRVMLIRDR